MKIVPTTIKWRRGEDSHVESVCGNWSIFPQYNHSTRPQSYNASGPNAWNAVKWAHTQAEAKRMVESYLSNEAAKVNALLRVFRVVGLV